MSQLGNQHPYPAQPLKILFTKGTEYEIGRQHAEQMGESVSCGMAKFYGDFWRRLLANPPEHWLEKVVFQLGTFLLDPVLVKRLLRSVPESMKDRIRGMADASGGDVNELMTTLVLPDLFPFLQATVARLKPRTFVDVRTTPMFGCSSFVSSAERFLVGRNLDFPGVAYWDRYQAIQLFDRPGKLKYLGFLTAEYPWAG